MDDARAFIDDCDILIVPLLSGSGMRIKIIEAMAAGKAVISTRVGAEGIMAEEGKDILLADTADEFRKQVARLAASPTELRALGAQARELVERDYSIEGTTRRFLEFYVSLGIPERKAL